ncbi:Tol biopolymer transport system component [Saccharothrix tamanrassetensis]|uniref:Tol biopolymer transport system component n=1 Tax=Saccharothrix tamanrassetensis TaxID=1051531 RepID=A0A841CM50_9PSEU|nr:amidohydrolase family protein [Saccharothrix tamanrassetensis]MBB5958013.1 Tol biopolymer transport system component [Saccharothrix tamanrassetensis]
MRTADLRRFGGVALVCVLAVSSATAAEARGHRPPTTVTVSEGTNLAVAVSPRDGTIVFDLQGQLFSMPRSGGTATPIGEDFLDPFWPVFSPDGSRIAIQSFVDGMFHIRTVTADGRNPRTLTRGEYDDLYPAWSPDGERIAFTSDREGTEDVWTVDVRSGALKRITTAATREAQPTWAPDGRSIAYVQGNTVESVDLATGAVRTVVPASPGLIAAPSWSPDGRRLAFVRGGQGGRALAVAEGGAVRQVGTYNDVFAFPPRWLSADELIYGANGRIAVSHAGSGDTRVVPFKATFSLQRDRYHRKEYDFDSRRPQRVRGIAGPALSPDGRSVVFKALNDLWLMPIGGKPTKLTRDPFYEVDPAWSRDGTKIAYASDKAGTEDLYVLDVASRREQRVTSSPGAEVAPTWSPDGRTLAFQDQAYQTFTLDVASGATTRVLGPQNAPGRPSWSPDGRTLALTVSVSERNQIMLADLASGTTKTVEPAPFGSVSTRGDDGPIWSPDGRFLAFSMDSTIWVLPVGPGGNPTGPARQVTREASDAPSWGDAKTLLYLHNGKLRLTAVDNGKPRDVPVDLAYTRDRPNTRTVIHAGRLWDGRNAEPRTDVDILVDGNRIERIEPHRPDRPRDGRRFVDASGLTVTPGLVDMHVHQHLRSKFVGDRQGRLLLSYGITTTRSTGDPVYRALEDRESLDAGARTGPRFFMTGEMLEGSRVGWEFARPVRSEQQLGLELSRVRELDYDLVKTYERFPFDWQAEVTGRAHRLGIPTTSHYLYPGLAHGVDMKEHLAGPSKWGFGFARDASWAGVYEDVIQLASRGGMPFSTTLFSAGSMLADDPAMVDDPRVRTLYTPQEWQALYAKLLCAQGRGPCGFLDGTPEQARRDVGTITRLLAAGGTVLAGTDAPLDSMAVSLHLNLRAMAKYGVTPFQALQSATLLSARQLGVEDDLGSVEEGKLADLVFTEGDPSRDVAALSDIRQVMKNGRLSTVEELLAPFGGGTAPR